MSRHRTGGQQARPLSFTVPLFALVGPTASGKESTAAYLARGAGAEILSMDSMKVYRGMDIGTAKAGAATRQRVPHHLLDLAEPTERFTTRRWLDAAEAAVEDIAGRGGRPLFSGGTALYLKALLYGLFEGPSAQVELREQLAARPLDELHRRLSEVDPITAAKVHQNDLRRVIRALEVFEVTGRPASELRRQWEADPSRSNLRIAGIRRSREDLYQRMDLRVDRMIEAGLVEEVRGLLDRGLGDFAAQALGYKEIHDYLRGEIPDLPEAVRVLKSRTRAFARRQFTFFKHFSIEWVTVDPGDAVETVAGRVAERFGWELS